MSFARNFAAGQQIAQTAMDEYDLDGWKSKDLINPDDVSILNKR